MPQVELSAGTIDYDDTGGTGSVVVLVHGLLMNGAQWRHVVADLRRNYRCILPTLPMGAHRRPMRPDADLSLRGLGRILTEFMERLDLRDVTLCFNDWCGAQVMIADGGVGRVGRLVLVSCEAFENYPPGLPGRLAAITARVPGAVAFMRRTLLSRRLRQLPMFFGSMSKRGVPDDIMREWLRPLAQPEIRRDFRKYAGDTSRGKRDLLAATEALQAFDRPVLIVWASEDRIMPLEDGRRLAKVFPNSQLVEIPDSFTLVPEDQPALLVARLRDFLAAHRPAQDTQHPANDRSVARFRRLLDNREMNFTEQFVQRGQHRIYAREYAGEEPTIILMHGFPDNLHLYDRLIRHLSPPRRVVAFDFLGWGASDKPLGYPYTAKNQEVDLDAVVKELKLGQVVLVAHDASGPPAIDWALIHSKQVAALVLLNTYYCAMPTLRPPEAIFLFSTPLVRNVARPISAMFGHLIFRRMYWWQVGRFFRDAEVRNKFVPLLYQQFEATPSTRPAFFSLNQDLLSTIRSGSRTAFKLKEFRRPVRIIFGDADPYLNKGVAQKFHELFPASDLFLLPKARHFVQMDEPEEVARLILSTPTTQSNST